MREENLSKYLHFNFVVNLKTRLKQDKKEKREKRDNEEKMKEK